MACWAVGHELPQHRHEVVSFGEDYSGAETSKLAWLVSRLMAKYGIGAFGVIRHCDVTGKRGPAPYVSAGKWAALKAAITAVAASGGVRLRPLRGAFPT